MPGRKRELILFSLLSVVFSERVFTEEVFNEVNDDRGSYIVLGFLYEAREEGVC